MSELFSTVASSEQGMRVDRAFAFIDLSGFTSYTETYGDAEAVAVLRIFRAIVRDVAGRRGVRVAKWLGDGAMFVAIDTESLIDAIVEVEHLIDESDCKLNLRGGIAAGPVLLFEGDDYIGGPVNLAARLCDVAQPHEIIAPADITTWLLVNAEKERIGARQVSGFPEPIELVRLGKHIGEP